MKTTGYTSPAGHTLKLAAVEALPENAEKREVIGDEQVYAVRNWDDQGHTFFHIAKVGKEWMGWYNAGRFYTSFGKTAQDAINKMVEDGWLYA